METASEQIPQKHICLGLLAHVDAGKTTLSEGLLYTGGTIRKIGRVDKQDAYLDMFAYERERGITIFSKQAVLTCGDVKITLLDTPGHVDFSAETERVLQVLDYAVLVISGADGVQGHTETLWRLLKDYRIPVFVFVNKMDQPGTERGKILQELQQRLSDAVIPYEDTARFREEAAMCKEEALEEFLETGDVSDRTVCGMIEERRLFPCFFGSALKMQGVSEFLADICRLAKPRSYPREFGAKVYKIARDENGNRLTYLKVTGGSLKVKETVPVCPRNGRAKEEGREEKIDQIRIYSGARYETVPEVRAGEICAVTGLLETYPGEGLGAERMSAPARLEPVLTYRMLLPEEIGPVQILPKLRQLEEEEPLLHILWNEEHQEILLQVMGEVQTELLKRQIADRFKIAVGFDTGHIVYKETIADTAEGVGHFEPLRHYAEVHLLLEPGERGSGIVYDSVCSEDILDRNWQRLILSNLKAKQHVGVLTGSAVTDLKITLASGRAHPKHTEGGDFREAAWRAVRQGLNCAESVLLEPYYAYRLEVPEAMIGRAMTDMELKYGSIEGPEISGKTAVLTGAAPAALMQDYAKEVASYTKGTGRLHLSYGGYRECHNPEEVIAQIGYDSEADLEHPAASIFCQHGAGYYVEWDRVPEFMHLESILAGEAKEGEKERERSAPGVRRTKEEWIDAEEVDAILAKTLNANKREKSQTKKGGAASRQLTAAKASPPKSAPPGKKDTREEYLLVDGYNIIFAWEELSKLAKTNMDGARGRLLDILCNYRGMKSCHLIVVFDAYRVAGHKTEFFDYHNIHVVYTKEAETADAYIERFAHENARKYRVTVATSDGLEQIIIHGAGCLLLSAKELWQEISLMNRQIAKEHIGAGKGGRAYLFDGLSKESAKELYAAVSEDDANQT